MAAIDLNTLSIGDLVDTSDVGIVDLMSLSNINLAAVYFARLYNLNVVVVNSATVGLMRLVGLRYINLVSLVGLSNHYLATGNLTTVGLVSFLNIICSLLASWVCHKYISLFHRLLWLPVFFMDYVAYIYIGQALVAICAESQAFR